MIYLDNGATSFVKPPAVRAAVLSAMEHCANPGRGGYPAAMAAAETVFRCRESAAKLFGCQPEQVAFTSNCTHGLNIAIHSLVHPGDKVLISGFEHNAVTRPLHALGAQILVAGRKLFDWHDTLTDWENALRQRPKAAICTHVSNVFGYILPIAEISALCKQYGVPLVVDAAQSAGSLPVRLNEWGADFIAMPGHKGLLGPQGTGLLLCGREPEPLLFGGTGSNSREQSMPSFLPDRLEAGTLNVPGIAGLNAGIHYINRMGLSAIFRREHAQLELCARELNNLGYRVICGEHQAATVSFVPNEDCEIFAEKLGRRGVAVRAGLHCAPLAHESAGTLESGTVRISFGYDASAGKTREFLRILSRLS